MSDPNKHHRNRRKKLLVLHQMQSRIIKSTTLFPLIALTILTITLTVFCRKLMTEAATEEVVLPSLEPFLATVICLTAAFAATILYVALRFSQRIAGPTYRITETLKQIREGDQDIRIRLRSGDYLDEIADELNATLDWIAAESGSSPTSGSTEGNPADVDAVRGLAANTPRA